MSRTQTYEQSLLYGAEKILSACSDKYTEKMLVIEACAALYGNYDISDYWKAFNIDCPNVDWAKNNALKLFREINNTGIKPSMAISCLAREPIPLSEMKKQGAFYTDYRLAAFVANDCERHIKKNCNVADIAAGSGILLAGIAEKYFEKYSNGYDEWISDHVYAFDLSAYALRGACAALSIHISSIDSLIKMFKRWSVCDALFSEKLDDIAFDIVVGNPPWGKTKLFLHTFVNGNGANHIYGSDYNCFDEKEFKSEKQKQLLYSKRLKESYTLMGDAEPDMYMAFLQRAISLVKKKGHLSYIVPAGLIRSQGTEALRRYLINEGNYLSYFLLDNKARFFLIDSRFKFVVVSFNKASSKKMKCSEMELSICSADKEGVRIGENIIYGIDALERIRSDLTIPECRTSQEKDLFFKIYENGCAWKEIWKADVAREVDMTKGRKHFHNKKNKNDVPVIEGRMVQQFRFGAKAYQSGSGRSAIWIPTAKSKLRPQFYISKDDLSKALQKRVNCFRVGFCDIAGQTNERSMMSTLIPPGVVCGNKVPTIIFDENSFDYMYFWLGVTNSFAFDWLLRRTISTTVNYFLLFSMPMPNVDITCDTSKGIITKSRELCEMGENFYTDDKMEILRAEIDLLVAEAYGLDFSDIELLLKDFPLLDRAQKTLVGESKSTITRDLLLSLAEKRYNNKPYSYSKRYSEYKNLKAKAYIHTEMTVLCK